MDYNEDGSGSETNPSPGLRPQRDQPTFAHTMTDLEDEANRMLVEQCKIEACVNVFFSGIEQIAKDRSIKLAHGSPSFEGLEGEKLDTLKTELRENVDRLVPGTCDSDIPILSNEIVKQALAKKWPQGRYGYFRGPRDRDRGSIPTSLLEVLMERQARERSTGAHEGSFVPSTDNLAAELESCRQLKEFIDGEQASASFACGGTINVDKDSADKLGENPTSPPIRIFWSHHNDTSARKLVLPLDESTQEATPQMLRDLVSSCDPASFGLGDKDVIDPAYRKAGKINPDQFATSFHPADFGILESIEKVLLPSISRETDNILQFRKIKAELYKLNAYSGPSGLFRKHVDTPRSDSQIGSLVVCLPSPFEGGSLLVQHGGQTIEFDWSQQSSSTIQWAAFYSDCEHEIKTITYGDRITLTYNLFVTEPVNAMFLSPTPTVDPETLPLYTWMKNLLAQPNFMKEGGVLGMFCSHAYPHTSELANIQLPRALKGADLVLYSIFKSLGIELTLAPILDQDLVYGRNPALGITGKVEGSRSSWRSFTYYDAFDTMMSYLKDGRLTLNTRDSHLPHPDFTDVDQQWKWLLMSRKISGMDDIIDHAVEKGYPLKPNSFYQAGFTRVGKRFRPYSTDNFSTEDCGDEDEIFDQCYPVYNLPGITWVTQPKHQEMAFSHIAYGNESSITSRYSCVAILAVIPPAEKRGKSHDIEQ